MQTKNLAKLLIALLLHLSLMQTGLAAEPVSPAPTTNPKLVAFKQKIVTWGINKNVQLQLLSKEKLAGRVAEIQDDAFVLQMLKDGTISSRTVPYAELKNLKAKGDGISGKAFAMGLVGGAVAFVGIILTMFAIYED